MPIGGDVAAAGAGGAGGQVVVASGGRGGAAAGSAGAGGAQALGPPYPIVLCHGFFGFEQFAGASFATYFYGVKAHLAQHGETEVFTPAVDPFNTSVIRGAQLSEAVSKILAETGRAKVNLVGHSQGGLDVRVVAHDHPDWVASVTTIATPHYGTPVADVVLKIVPDPNAQALVDALVKAVGAPLYDATGQSTSLVKSLAQMSSDGIAKLNADYPNVAGIPYRSLTGRSNMSPGYPDCVVPDAPPWIAKYDVVLDPANTLLAPTGGLLSGNGVAPLANDGLVRARDAKWGKFLGCVPADHFDEIGQVFGQSPGIGNTFDYKQLYLDLVLSLREGGLLGPLRASRGALSRAGPRSESARGRRRASATSALPSRARSRRGASSSGRRGGDARGRRDRRARRSGCCSPDRGC